jgi:hypothetical protein
MALVGLWLWLAQLQGVHSTRPHRPCDPIVVQVGTLCVADPKTCFCRPKHLLPNNGGPPTQAQMQAAMARALKFSQCMRKHGIPNFPDPTEGASGHNITIGGNVDFHSPQVQSAQRTCQSYLPGF